MKIVKYIKDNVIGKDNVVTLYDISNAVYGTDKPNKAQRVSINRAIRNLNGKGLLSNQSWNHGKQIVYNPLSDKSILLTMKKRDSEINYSMDCDELWEKMSDKERDLSMNESNWIYCAVAMFKDPENADKIKSEHKENAMKRFMGMGQDKVSQAEASQAFDVLVDYMTENEMDDVNYEKDGVEYQIVKLNK